MNKGVKTTGKIFLSIGSIFLTLLLAEIGFRIAAYRKDQRTLEHFNTTRRPENGASVHWSNMIQLSQNPRVIFELIPNLSVMFLGEPVTINENGFRGPLFPEAKPPGTVRIVGLGDSVMFGWGVQEQEAYLEILSRKLNTEHPECTWEIINTAVPGYNTAMEVEVLEEKGLSYEPDLVIIGLIGNDLNLPNFIREQENYFSFAQSFLLKSLGGDMEDLRMIRAPKNKKGRGFESDPRKVPEFYREMVGIEGYRKAMTRLQALSRQHDFRVLVFEAFKENPELEAINRELGFPIVNSSDLWETYAREKNLDVHNDRRLSPKDPHPSAKAHTVMAEALFLEVVASGLSCGQE